LLKQLSSSPLLFTVETLQAIVASEASHLFILECEGEPVGMLTVGEYLAPTGRKMWIEDVVVDEACRGRSFGAMLVKHAIELASSLGAGTLMLTSRPSRVAANALYRSCGFQPKETNMYRMAVEDREG
jgi:ribosomal protein S18 acetylase RimI-like enzyme